MMGQETTGGVPATEAQVPFVAHDTHRPGLGEKMKLTLANAKERIHGGSHSSSTTSTPTSTATPSSPRASTGTASSNEHVKKGAHLSPLSSGREVHPPSPDGGRVGDIASPRTPGAIPRRQGDPASPKIPHKDWGERIYEKLPFSHVNPYSVGHPVDRPNANPYVTGSDSTEPTAPGPSPSSKQSPKLVAKIKNLVTGQKPTQGAATENATLNTPDIPAAGAGGVRSEGYAQQPIPTEHSTGEFYERAKSRMGIDEKRAADDKWPSPARPGVSAPKEKSDPAHLH